MVEARLLKILIQDRLLRARLLDPHGRKILGFCHDIEEIFALLNCYAVYVLSLPTFRDSQYVQIQGSNSPRNSWTV